MHLVLAIIILVLLVFFKLYSNVNETMSSIEPKDSVLNFKNKSVLFIGPADVESSKIINPLDYDYVILPNNMSRVFDKPYNNLIIMTNQYFATNNADYIINKNPSGILCTTPYSYTFMKDKLKEKNSSIPIMKCPFPSNWPKNYIGKATSWPLGLSFLLQYMVTHAPELKKLHVVGITFYDKGQEYRKGYKLIEMGESHDVENDKTYAREIIKKHKNITIDYPL